MALPGPCLCGAEQPALVQQVAEGPGPQRGQHCVMGGTTSRMGIGHVLVPGLRGAIIVSWRYHLQLMWLVARGAGRCSTGMNSRHSCSGVNKKIRSGGGCTFSPHLLTTEITDLSPQDGRGLRRYIPFGVQNKIMQTPQLKQVRGDVRGRVGALCCNLFGVSHVYPLSSNSAGNAGYSGWCKHISICL